MRKPRDPGGPAAPRADRAQRQVGFCWVSGRPRLAVDTWPQDSEVTESFKGKNKASHGVRKSCASSPSVPSQLSGITVSDDTTHTLLNSSPV